MVRGQPEMARDERAPPRLPGGPVGAGRGTRRPVCQRRPGTVGAAAAPGRGSAAGPARN